MRAFVLRLATLVAVASLSMPGTVQARGRSGGSSHSSSSHTSKSSAGKTEHVTSYTRKDGKTVKGYDRHPAGTAPKK